MIKKYFWGQGTWKTKKPSKFAQGVSKLSRALRFRSTVSKTTQVLPTIRVHDGENATDGDKAPTVQNGLESKTSG